MPRPIDFHRPFVKHYQQRIAKQAKLRQQYAERLSLFSAGDLDGRPLR
jgi:hypothetical protein